ncbi:MAG: hypothetical protein ACNA7X_00365 [Dehalococcoidia bacterium]
MCHSAECGCERHAMPAPAYHHLQGCCCGSGHAPRRFRTREEIVEGLEEYLRQLRAEAGAVEEHIAELKKKD